MTDRAINETRLRREGAIAILTLHNLAKRNAMSPTVRQTLHRHITELMADKACRAIVITGAGEHFCAGADVGAMKGRTEAPPTFIGRRLRAAQGSVTTTSVLIQGPKPVVTAVEGSAVGAGFSLAIASEYTVAATNARFCAAQILRGLCPDGGLYYSLTARCGPGRAREIVLSGRMVSAAQAEQYGIAHELTAPGKTLEAAMVAAERFAAVPPLAFALAKSAMVHSYHTLESCFRAEQDYQPVVGLSKDHKESVAAFLEKRKPTFTGE
jgi:enoyl-CoA hydratase/carnithine racemase